MTRLRSHIKLFGNRTSDYNIGENKDVLQHQLAACQNTITEESVTCVRQ